MDKDLNRIYTWLVKLEESLLAFAEKNSECISKVHPEQVSAAYNLLHYTVFRSQDIRPLQDLLHKKGLSSLVSSESHLLSQIQAVLQRLGKEYTRHELRKWPGFESGRRALQVKSNKVFGIKEDTLPHIMVTLDKKNIDQPEYVRELLLKGMSVARINCAHDDEVIWKQLIDVIKEASGHTGKDCKIYMDLAGPKLRTAIYGKGKKEGKVKVEEGELFFLAEKDAGYDKKETVIGCTTPGLTQYLKKGDRIVFDDGQLEALVCDVKAGLAKLKMIRNSQKKRRIKERKGMNFPDSDLQMPPLTPADIDNLPFICQHADMVGYSFVKAPSDLEVLQRAINDKEKRPAIILKIETPDAVKVLPELFLQGMREPLFGVMIARGDLAVEVGFERLSEVQEEILWFCEAGHIPVIWATQVLESLNKTGIATRSEMTDAAHAIMAECVMINKGTHTLEVLETLYDILRRSGEHRSKKRYLLRPLNIASRMIRKGKK